MKIREQNKVLDIPIVDGTLSPGGGGGGVDFEGFPSIYATDFNLYNPANLTVNTSITTGWPFATGFVVYSKQQIRSFSVIINALSTLGTSRFNCAIYKYDYLNEVYDFVVESPQEFDTSVTGTTGLNTITLPSVETLDAGFYIMVGVGNNNSGASIKSANQYTTYFGFNTSGTRILQWYRIAGGYKAPGAWDAQLAASYWNSAGITNVPKVLVNY